MYVEHYGSGPEAYFGIHGWGGDHQSFAPLAAHVPTCASLYSLDLPGCGQSPAPHEWNAQAIVDEIVEALAATRARQVTLVGNCGGAIFSLLAAQRAEKIIKRIVMIDAFAYLPRYFRLFLSDGFGRRAYNATFANPFGRWLTNQSLRGNRREESDLTASFTSVDHEASRRYLALFSEIGVIEQFSDVHAPVDIIYGEKSFGAVRKSVALWQSALPQARVLKLVGAGHLPIVEATEPLSGIIFACEEASELVQAKAPQALQSEAEL